MYLKGPLNEYQAFHSFSTKNLLTIDLYLEGKHGASARNSVMILPIPYHLLYPIQKGVWNIEKKWKA